jgi:hypothetical protein
MTPEETFGQLLVQGKAWRVVEARLEGNASALVLKALRERGRVAQELREVEATENSLWQSGLLCLEPMVIDGAVPGSG